MDSKIDITRLNRHERRKFQKVTGVPVLGRNLPYIKDLHGSLEDYKAQRAKEIAQDQEEAKR